HEDERVVRLEAEEHVDVIAEDRTPSVGSVEVAVVDVRLAVRQRDHRAARGGDVDQAPLCEELRIDRDRSIGGEMNAMRTGAVARGCDVKARASEEREAGVVRRAVDRALFSEALVAEDAAAPVEERHLDGALHRRLAKIARRQDRAERSIIDRQELYALAAR